MDGKLASKGCFEAIFMLCGKNTAISLVNCGVFTAIFVYLQP